MKYGQLKEYNKINIFFLQNQAEYEAIALVFRSLFLRKTLYEVKCGKS